MVGSFCWSLTFQASRVSRPFVALRLSRNFPKIPQKNDNFRARFWLAYSRKFRTWMNDMLWQSPCCYFAFDRLDIRLLLTTVKTGKWPPLWEREPSVNRWFDIIRNDSMLKRRRVTANRQVPEVQTRKPFKRATVGLSLQEGAIKCRWKKKIAPQQMRITSNKTVCPIIAKIWFFEVSETLDANRGFRIPTSRSFYRVNSWNDLVILTRTLML